MGGPQSHSLAQAHRDTLLKKTITNPWHSLVQLVVFSWFIPSIRAKSSTLESKFTTLTKSLRHDAGSTFGSDPGSCFDVNDR